MLFSDEHAIYLSVVDITISDEGVSGEIKVFSDDLYDALREFHGADLKSTMTLVIADEAEAYFQNYLKVKTSGEQHLPLSITNITIEGDSHWIQFLINIPPDLDRVTLQAAYFYELFPTQQNIVTVTAGDQKNYYRFRSADQIEQLILD